MFADWVHHKKYSNITVDRYISLSKLYEDQKMCKPKALLAVQSILTLNQYCNGYDNQWVV